MPQEVSESTVILVRREQNAEPYSMEYPMEYLNGVPLKIIYWSNLILYQHGEVFRFTYFCYSSMQFTNWPPSWSFVGISFIPCYSV